MDVSTGIFEGELERVKNFSMKIRPQVVKNTKKSQRSWRVLGIETSCDETAVSILRVQGSAVRVDKNLVSSQIPIHQMYGGVVPEVAARAHVVELIALLDQALGKTYMKRVDAIAVTHGPGLATALRVGLEAARCLAAVSGKPIVGVNHLEGHIASSWLNAANRRQWKFPLLALIVSGGHTELIFIKDFCEYSLIGQTRDDAAGEAFDKSAKLMGLPYPGGPQIARAALNGDSSAFALPRPMLHDGAFDFSFSGLKTAVRQTWEALSIDQREARRADLAASTQQAIVDVLVTKTILAAHQTKVRGVLLVGGVSANRALRERLGEAIKRDLRGVSFLPSDIRYVTDNAAMIAAAGAWHLQRGDAHDWKKMDVDPELDLF